MYVADDTVVSFMARGNCKPSGYAGVARMAKKCYNTGVNHIKSDRVLEAPCHLFSTCDRGARTMSNHTPIPHFIENLDDYAPWVATHGLTAPYGECQCGCGRNAPVAKKTLVAMAWRKDHPKRFVSGHNNFGPPIAIRLWNQIDKRGPNDCWEWRGCTNAHGYGVINVGEGNRLAHRLAYESENGLISEGLKCLHRCDNPPCCNPIHLFVGTQRDNTADMVRKGRNQKGSARPNAQITEDDVVVIRRLCAGGALQKDVAAQYGIGKQIVSSVVTRTTWKHVP